MTSSASASPHVPPADGADLVSGDPRDGDAATDAATQPQAELVAEASEDARNDDEQSGPSASISDQSASGGAPATREFFLTCPKGVEPLLLTEARELGAATARETVGGVYASGDLAFAYRACLWSRLAARVLLPLSRFALDGGPEALYDAAHALPWPSIFDLGSRFAIEVAGRSKAVPHSHYAALKVKDAVADRFRAAVGKRPDADAAEPDVRIHLHLTESHGTLSLDLSGESLHRRGYRANAAVEAPLKENLAAALLIKAGWPEIAARGGGLLDPFCGSGTLVIEAAWIAADVAPNLLRPRFGFHHWLEHDEALWQRLREEAIVRRDAGLRRPLPLLAGRDRDEAAVRTARGNGARAGLTGKVDFTVGEATVPGQGLPGPAGLVIGNPPYGERLSDEAELVMLHSLLGPRIKRDFPGWRFALFTARPDLGHRLGLRAHKVASFYNGAIPCKLLLMEVMAARGSAAPVAPTAADLPSDAEGAESEALSVDADAAPQPVADAGTASPTTDRDDEFLNRLRKNQRHLAKWARRAGVSSYRLYDADLPHYAVAVDLYAVPELHAVVQEYAPPATVPANTAEARLRTALVGIAELLQLPPAQLHYKLRRAQKGTSQYQRQNVAERYFVGEEHGAKLWLNFEDYLDTGLFLDHRPLRRRLRAEAAGKRVLNLFCYTGAATIQAALGGAASTVSVDMSNTYLDWLAQNFELNGLAARDVEGREPLPAAARLPPHALVRADCLAWLALQAESRCPPQFDLVFCDPPTFSNSKKMEGSWDVQRDHVALLGDAAALLAPGGALYFSCNRQRFRLDTAALEALGLTVTDITAQTLDEDFRRPPPPHRAWRITR